MEILKRFDRNEIAKELGITKEGKSVTHKLILLLSLISQQSFKQIEHGICLCQVFVKHDL